MRASSTLKVIFRDVPIVGMPFLWSARFIDHHAKANKVQLGEPASFFLHDDALSALPLLLICADSSYASSHCTM